MMKLILILVFVALSVLFYFLRHILGGMVGLFKVVPVNEAHIRILNNKKEIFSSRQGQRSSYWYIPFITKLHKLPLCNLSVPVNDVKLNDKAMAKFVCDIACFINVDNIELAVERLTLTDTKSELGFNFSALQDDLRAIMESIGRTVVTKQTILDIYMNRQLLDEAITHEVEAVFPKWGIKLVDLELKDIKDAPNSSIIHDIEVKVASELRRDAEIKIAETNREAEIQKAKAEEEYRQRQIEKDENIGIWEQQKNQKIAKEQAIANKDVVEAEKELRVGRANVLKLEVEQQAEAEKKKLTIEAEGKASEIKQVGDSEAHVIQIKKEAEAAGTLKMAEALKEFDDMAYKVKMIEVQEKVYVQKYKSLAEAIQKADIKWILTGTEAQNFFGLNLNAAGGADLDQFIKETGISFSDIKSLVKKEKRTEQ